MNKPLHFLGAFDGFKDFQISDSTLQTHTGQDIVKLLKFPIEQKSLGDFLGENEFFNGAYVNYGFFCQR